MPVEEQGNYVSTHSRPKAAAGKRMTPEQIEKVSTHSRPKAAACGRVQLFGCAGRFNTQPPEGGCPQPPAIMA